MAKKENNFGRKIGGFGKAIIVGLGKKEDRAKSIVLKGQGKKTDPVLVQGAQSALEAAVEKPSQIEHTLGITTDLHCFSLVTKNFQGYVLVAYAAGKTLQKKFKESLRNSFLKFARTQGVAVAAQNSMDLKIQKVDFEKWSLKESDTLVKSAHDGAEIALTFIANDETGVSLLKSDDPTMLNLPLTEIETDDPLRFDLYLYMPINKKYLLYAKKEAMLNQDQKNNLRERGYESLAVRIDAADIANGYLTEQFLNRKIYGFNQEL